MECTNFRDDMLDVLYDEATIESRARLEQHLAGCAACREELAALRRLRDQLASWRLPASSAGPVSRRLQVPRLVQGLAWAAGLLLALGGAIRLSGASVELQRGPVTLRLGAASASTELEARLVAYEEQHQRDLEALRARPTTLTDADRQALLQSVRELIHDAELRQADALDTRLASVEERAEARRRYDLARVSAGLSYLDSKAGQQAARTTELVSYMLQAAQPR